MFHSNWFLMLKDAARDGKGSGILSGHGARTVPGLFGQGSPQPFSTRRMLVSGTQKDEKMGQTQKDRSKATCVLYSGHGCRCIQFLMQSIFVSFPILSNVDYFLYFSHIESRGCFYLSFNRMLCALPICTYINGEPMP